MTSNGGRRELIREISMNLLRPYTLLYLFLKELAITAKKRLATRSRPASQRTARVCAFLQTSSGSFPASPPIQTVLFSLSRNDTKYSVDIVGINAKRVPEPMQVRQSSFEDLGVNDLTMLRRLR